MFKKKKVETPALQRQNCARGSFDNAGRINIRVPQQQGRTHFGVAIEFMNTRGAVASTNHSETVQGGRYVCNKSRFERRRQEILAAAFLFFRFQV